MGTVWAADRARQENLKMMAANPDLEPCLALREALDDVMRKGASDSTLCAAGTKFDGSFGLVSYDEDESTHEG